MPGYLLTFVRETESTCAMSSVFTAEDHAGAREIAQRTLLEKGASSGILYRYQRTPQRGFLVELWRIELESSRDLPTSS